MFVLLHVWVSLLDALPCGVGLGKIYARCGVDFWSFIGVGSCGDWHWGSECSTHGMKQIMWCLGKIRE